MSLASSAPKTYRPESGRIVIQCTLEDNQATMVDSPATRADHLGERHLAPYADIRLCI